MELAGEGVKKWPMTGKETGIKLAFPNVCFLLAQGREASEAFPTCWSALYGGLHNQYGEEPLGKLFLLRRLRFGPYYLYRPQCLSG